MKILSLAACALLSLGYRAHANPSAAVSNDTSQQVPQKVMQDAQPGDLLTRTSEDGRKFEVQDDNGHWVSAAIQQTSDDTATVTGANGDQGQLISTNFDEQSTQNASMQLAAYRIWHRGWGHFGWHRRWWYPGRHYWHGGWGWHYRRWHRGWRRW